MGDLSKHFSRHEFECRCCGQFIVNNGLIISLEELRDLTGKPITVNCGYRCPDHNLDVKGVPHSQHLLGKAADIVVRGISPKQVAELAKKVPAFKSGGIGVYRTFVHVDVREKGPARWSVKHE